MKTKIYYVLMDKKSGKFFSAGNKVFWTDDLESARIYTSAKQAKSSAGQHRCIQIDPDTNRLIGLKVDRPTCEADYMSHAEWEHMKATSTKYEYVNPAKIPEYEIKRLIGRTTGVRPVKTIATRQEAIDHYNSVFRQYGYKPEWQVHEVTASIAITAVNV